MPRTTPMNVLSNVSNTILLSKSLKQNELLNVILHGDKNFDNNNNQSIMGTKTFIAIKVYSPQPSNLSDILSDSTNHFFEKSYIIQSIIFFFKNFYS